jgi:tRNA threonylcarbamoyl adenosine modification protein YjeE
MKGKFFLAHEAETEAAGREIGKRLRPGDIIKITGPLGAGKTTLARGIAAELGVDPGEVHSPTFSLVHEYEGRTNLIKHCDFYRLPENSELEDFGGLEFFASDAIFLVEWPERFRHWEALDRRRLWSADLAHDAKGRVLVFSSITQIVD